jgi:hypothetical protein
MKFQTHECNHVYGLYVSAKNLSIHVYTCINHTTACTRKKVQVKIYMKNIHISLYIAFVAPSVVTKQNNEMAEISDHTNPSFN